MSASIRRTTLAVALTLLAAPGVPAQEGGRNAAEGPSGLRTGETAPKFTLKDQDGKDRSLDDLLRGGKVALVFYRSADW